MIDIEALRRGVGGVFQLRRSRSALCSPQRPDYSMSLLSLTRKRVFAPVVDEVDAVRPQH